MGKKKKEVAIEIVGGNAEGVTGSCTRIDFYGRTILFELGMVQDNSTIFGNYKDNCAILNRIKPKKIEMVILGHNHCDHIGSVIFKYSMITLYHSTFKKITMFRSFYSSTTTSNTISVTSDNFHGYFMFFLCDGFRPPFILNFVY